MQSAAAEVPIDHSKRRNLCKMLKIPASLEPTWDWLVGPHYAGEQCTHMSGGGVLQTFEYFSFTALWWSKHEISVGYFVDGLLGYKVLTFVGVHLPDERVTDWPLMDLPVALGISAACKLNGEWEPFVHSL